MAYQSLYLKYRPRTFDQVIGQDHICRTLRNALREGKVAHAYLFCGPRGTGKTTSARILAKALSCENGVTESPCDVCESCSAIREGRLLDVVEIDAASNTGVDNIRSLKEILGYAPTWGRYRIYIIDEVHMLSTAAWNALLKTLEEPPDYAYFIMATTDPQKVLPTILSRCQRFDFRRVPQPMLVGHLGEIASSEGVVVDEAALWAIARLSEGCVRDAITMFDQIRAYAEDSVTVGDVNAVLGTLNEDALFTLTDIVAEGDAASAFRVVEDLAQEGKDFSQVTHGLTRHVRNLLLVKSGCTSVGALEADEPTIAKLTEQAKRFTMPMLMGSLSALSDARDDLKWNHQHRLVLEIALVTMMTQTPATVGAPTEGSRATKPSAPAAPPASPAPVEASGEGTADDDDADALLAQPEVAEEPPADDDAMPDTATPEWQRAVLKVAEIEPKLGRLLTSSVGEFRGDNELVVMVGSLGASFLQDALKDRKLGREIRSAIEGVYGSELRITVRAANRPNGDIAPPNGTGAAEPPAAPSALVLDMFEGSEEI